MSPTAIVNLLAEYKTLLIIPTVQNFTKKRLRCVAKWPNQGYVEIGLSTDAYAHVFRF